MQPEHSTLRVENVSRLFLKLRAVSDVSLTISPGERVLLLGANGSGKSTLLRMCCGLLHPTSGAISPLHGTIAHYGSSSYLYSRFSVRENIELYAACLGVTDNLEKHIATWGLERFAGQRVCELSKGQQSLASLARAFLGHPRYIMLDEPSSALDEGVTRRMLERINDCLDHDPHGFAVIATHDIERLKGFATRYVILRHGKLVYDTKGSDPRELDVISHYLEAQA